jgi:hypothetical protein
MLTTAGHATQCSNFRTAVITYPSAAYDIFVNLSSALGLEWDNARKPVNVLCTGAGPAAALVPVCGVWAALTYPQVTCVKLL